MYRDIDAVLPERWDVRRILSAGPGGCMRSFPDAEVSIELLDDSGSRPRLIATVDFGFDGQEDAQEFIRRVAALGNGCGYLVKSGGTEAYPHAFPEADATRYVGIRDDGCDA